MIKNIASNKYFNFVDIYIGNKKGELEYLFSVTSIYIFNRLLKLVTILTKEINYHLSDKYILHVQNAKDPLTILLLCQTDIQNQIISKLPFNYLQYNCNYYK